MDDTISRRAAIDKFEPWLKVDGYSEGELNMLKAVLYELRVMPPVDVVRVVRCKDCKWGREISGNIECFADRNAPPEYHGYDWFCPNGERRTDG